MSYFYSGATLKKGSTGNDVSEWQKFLALQGLYSGSIDGTFGDDTEAATKAYQTANGLSADGIAGAQTFGKAGFKNYNAAVDAPKLPSLPNPPKYNATSWDSTAKGKAAAGAYGTAKDAVNGYGPFAFSENAWLEKVKGDIANYGDFSYDFNEDALYQQAVESYKQMGKMAMQDTMGQAAAMTGGYGNSYAQTVGQQAYQSYLQEASDMLPEYYQMALDRYKMGKEDLYNQYGMLLSEYEREYGLHSDEYNMLLDKLGIARDDYYSGADMHYTEQNNKNTALGNEFDDAMTIWGAESDDAWKQAEWDENVRRYAREQASADSGDPSDKATVDKDGNLVVAPDNTPTDTDLSGIRAKLEGFTSNTEVESYLERQEAAGVISHDEALVLMAEFMDDNEVYIDTEDGKKAISLKGMVGSSKGWSVEDNGGVNWLWGVDNNARVKAPNGEIYRLDELVDKLESEGMETKDAKSAVKELQKKLGI